MKLIAIKVIIRYNSNDHSVRLKSKTISQNHWRTQPTWFLRFLRGGGTGGGAPGSFFGGKGGLTCVPPFSRSRRRWCDRRFGCLWFASSQLSQNTSLHPSQRIETLLPPHKEHFSWFVEFTWPFDVSVKIFNFFIKYNNCLNLLQNGCCCSVDTAKCVRKCLKFGD